MMNRMLFLSVLVSLSYGQDFAPPCQWHREGGENLYEATEMCAATSDPSIFTKYYCDSTPELYLGSYSDSECTTLLSSALKYDHEYNCSLPLCSVDGGSGYDIATFEEHYEETDCTLYTERFYFVWDSSVGITGNSEHYKVNIYNDASLDVPFDGETIFYYSDAFVDGKAYCDVWSEDMADGACPDEQRLLSYSGTPNDAKTCYPQDCPYNKKPMAFDCAWVAHPSGGPCWWDTLNICGRSRHVFHSYDTGNVCKDAMIKCNDEQTAVSYYIYDSSDRSCSGQVIEEMLYTNDTYAFDCSLPTCGTPGTTTPVTNFRRYDIFNCGLQECGSAGCDLEMAAYSDYSWIYPEFCDSFPEICWALPTDCNDSNSGTYADNTYQYMELIGFNATATLDNKRSMCWSDSVAPSAAPTTGTPSASPTTQEPTDAPSASPTIATGSPTMITGAPTMMTDSPTTVTGSPSASPTTATGSPSVSPTTASPSASPTTGTPTEAPVTQSPTRVSTTSEIETTTALIVTGVGSGNGAGRLHTFVIFGVMCLVTCLSLM